MKRKNVKRLKLTILVAAVIILAILTVPLFIQIEGEQGLKAEDLAQKNGSFVNIPFEGTDGIDTYYVYQPAKENTDRNFILLHGSLYNLNTWNEVTDYLSAKGNVYAYDQIPYGLSEKLLENDWSGRNPYTIDSAVIQLKAFMDTLKIDSATLIGSSFGGVIAAEAALSFPEKIEEIVFVDAAIFVNESAPEWLINSPQMESLGPIFARFLAKGDNFYKRSYYDKTKLTAKRLELNKLATKVNNWDLAFWEYLKAWGTSNSNTKNNLTEISQRSLVISGDKDKIVPTEQSARLAKLLANGSLKIVENCGYLPHEERPKEFIKIIDNWLTK
ncbi:alpha/beta fold hydrolase [Halanaerobium sp. ST460_2HS_T2]|uniref:alpha/beta fold hydrolase n=1 Tax=Halanaerobium sp. ST460_2HS_T2 TaxID=2183914 RepID=UPI000DF33C2D|nr:alpha/beta hydrolase [Halanaerobium sp. ST460_2HS_T2]